MQEQRTNRRIQESRHRVWHRRTVLSEEQVCQRENGPQEPEHSPSMLPL